MLSFYPFTVNQNLETKDTETEDVNLVAGRQPCVVP
jgi:hypothetical protein